MVSSKKKDTPEIQERKPHKKKPDTFANIRQLPHPVEEILGLAIPSSDREQSESDYRSTAVPQYRSNKPEKQPETSKKPNKISNPTLKQASAITAVPQYRSTAVGPTKEFYRKPNEISDHLDRTLTAAESRILDHIYRLTIGFNRTTCRVTIRELLNRTGYRSDKTVRIALVGLVTKGKLTRPEQINSPQGDLYEILDSGTAVPQYSGKNYRSTAVKNTGHINTCKYKEKHDDDTLALSEPIRLAAEQIAGPGVMADQRWSEVGEVLAAELTAAAQRAGQINNVPAFFAEHLRRLTSRAGKSKPEAVKKESRPRSRQTREERLKKMIDETLALHVGDGNYSEADLIEDVMFKAKRAGVECDEDILKSFLER